MTYRQALDNIHARRRSDSTPTLARMQALMQQLGNPQEKLRCIQVAGTNGKGSTSTMIASIARESGLHTGLYLSPYITDFRERIQLDGEMISREDLVRLVEQAAPLADHVEGINEFEFITALAFCWFAEKNAELVVLETGLGGRYDATNIISRPLVSVITTIGLDHTAILGDTIEQIAKEKAGIIKSEVPAVTCPNQDVDALAVLMKEAAECGTKLVQPTGTSEPPKLSLDGTDFVWRGERYHLSLLGAHQVQNALTALAAVELAGIGTLENHKQGLSKAQIPARMEFICRNPLTILDGAHNPQGAQVLLEGMKLLGDRPITAIFASMQDKDSEGFLRVIGPHLRRLICVASTNPRSIDPHDLVAQADALGFYASVAHYPQDAWDLASAVAAAEDGAIVIGGSLFLAADLRPVILEEMGQ